MKKIDKIKKLKIHYKAENAWEGFKFKPYTLKLVELDEVLAILEEKNKFQIFISRCIFRFKELKSFIYNNKKLQ